MPTAPEIDPRGRRALTLGAPVRLLVQHVR